MRSVLQQCEHWRTKSSRGNGLVLNGWIDQDGVFHQAPEIDTARPESEFSNRVLNALIAEELIDEATAIAIASQEHTGFNAWVSEPIPAADADKRRFVARYLKRCPISLERLELIDNGLGATIRVTKRLMTVKSFATSPRWSSSRWFRPTYQIFVNRLRECMAHIAPGLAVQNGLRIILW